MAELSNKFLLFSNGKIVGGAGTREEAEEMAVKEFADKVFICKVVAIAKKSYKWEISDI